MYQPRRHLSQTWTTNCIKTYAFYTGKRRFIENFFDPIGEWGGRLPWIRTGCEELELEACETGEGEVEGKKVIVSCLVRATAMRRDPTDRIVTLSVQTEMSANSTCMASRRTDGVTSLVSRLMGCSPCPRWFETRPGAHVTTCSLSPMKLARQVQTNPTANTKKQMTANCTSWEYKLTTTVVVLVALLVACPVVSLAACLVVSLSLLWWLMQWLVRRPVHHVHDR